MANISFLPPFEAAWAGMKQRLFRPFDLGKWFTIGFTAWLAMLGENGGGGGLNYPGNAFKNAGPEMDNVSHFIHEHLAMIIGIATGVILFSMILGIALSWLHARGVFMYLDNIIHNRARVSESWHEFRREGNSLFWWQFVFGWICLFTFIAIVLVGLAMALPAIRHHRFDYHAGIALAVTIPLFLVFVITAGIISSLLNEFIAPIMWKHRVGATEGWRIWRRLIAGNGLSFVPFYLLRILFGMVASIAILLFGFCTCCCGFFLLAIPVVNATTMLPVSMTFSLYSLEFLRQFGPDGDCLTIAPPDIPPMRTPSPLS
jgi:hypothetical protein